MPNECPVSVDQKKIYARGIEQAEKHVLMALLCYNLKKMLRFNPQKAQIQESYAPTTLKC